MSSYFHDTTDGFFRCHLLASDSAPTMTDSGNINAWPTFRWKRRHSIIRYWAGEWWHVQYIIHQHAANCYLAAKHYGPMVLGVLDLKKIELQRGAVITRSIFWKTLIRHPLARPLGRDIGFLLWNETLIFILSQYVQCYMQPFDIGPRYNHTRLYICMFYHFSTVKQ